MGAEWNDYVDMPRTCPHMRTLKFGRISWKDKDVIDMVLEMLDELPVDEEPISMNTGGLPDSAILALNELEEEGLI